MSDSDDSSAVGGDCGADLQWEVSGDTLTITGTGAMGDYNKNAPWHGYNSTVTKLVLPDELSSIGDYAFWDMNNLTAVDISNCSKLTVIGDYAFSACLAMGSVILPDSVITIGDYAFYKCNVLVSVDMPNNLTSISKSMFQDCKKLASIDLPDNVTKISDLSFFACEDLTSVNISDDSKLTKIGDRAFSSCIKLDSFSIPASVTTIDKGAFGNTWRSTFIVDEGNKYYKAVNGCLLANNGTVLLTGPSDLKTVLVPDSVVTIGDQAFASHFDLSSIVMPSGLKNIGNQAFNATGLKSVVIPDGVKKIGDQAFAGCSLTSITLPDSLTVTGNGIFYSSGITSVVIPSSLKNINGMFTDCIYLTSIIIPDGMKEVSAYAFQRCTGLKSVVIPDSVKKIDISAFNGCTSLTSITLGSGINSIDDSSFVGCTSLTNLTLTGENKNASLRMLTGNKLPGMTDPFTVITIDGKVNLDNVSPIVDTHLVFNVGNDHIGGTSSATRDIRSDSDLKGSVYRCVSGSDVWVKDIGAIFTVTFEDDGAEKGSCTSEMTVVSGKEIILPVPIKTGYVFDDWCDVSDNIISSPYTVSGDIMLYAKYTENEYTISYDSNDGSGIMVNRTIKYSDLQNDGYLLDTCAFSPPAGKVFLGWVLGASVLYDENVRLYSESIAGDIKVYAVWSFSLVVTFDPNGGYVDPTEKDVIYGGKYGEIPTPTKNGYIFDGWYIGEKKVTSTSVVSTPVDHTLVASWSLPATYGVKVEVTFDPNGGMVYPTSKTVTYGREYGPLPMPENDGYTFDGWYYNGKMITGSSTVDTRDDHTLIAKWSDPSYDANGSDDGSKYYTPLIIVFAASALMFMMLLVLAYIRRRKDEDE